MILWKGSKRGPPNSEDTNKLYGRKPHPSPPISAAKSIRTNFHSEVSRSQVTPQQIALLSILFGPVLSLWFPALQPPVEANIVSLFRLYRHLRRRVETAPSPSLPSRQMLPEGGHHFRSLTSARRCSAVDLRATHSTYGKKVQINHWTFLSRFAIGRQMADRSVDKYARKYHIILIYMM